MTEGVSQFVYCVLLLLGSFVLCLQVHFAQVCTLLCAQGCWSLWTTITDTVALWLLVGCRQWEQAGHWAVGKTEGPAVQPALGLPHGHTPGDSPSGFR